MKIRKRILTEELRLPRNNKKSYTTNKKQKIMLSENQLQRLISIINEKKVNPKDAKWQKADRKGFEMQEKKVNPKDAKWQKADLEGIGSDSLGEHDVDGGPHSHIEDKPCRKCCKPKGQAAYGLAAGPGMPCECPKSHPEVPCKGKPTPPTQGDVTSEGRKLKTTHPINESDIQNMKKWFTRVNKAGTNYNPSIN